jgi:voltage-gated potassium channel
MIGVEEIVVGDEYSGNIIAASARNLGIILILDELLTSKFGNQFYKVPVPAHWLGKNIGEVTSLLKTQYAAILIALARAKLKKNLVNPPAEMQLDPEDQLVLIAQDFPKFTPEFRN